MQYFKNKCSEYDEGHLMALLICALVLIGEMPCDPCDHLLDGASAYRKTPYSVSLLYHFIFILC